MHGAPSTSTVEGAPGSRKQAASFCGALSLALPEAGLATVLLQQAHVGDLHAAFGEFRRVLKPGGRVCVLEITKPESRIAAALLKTSPQTAESAAKTETTKTAVTGSGSAGDKC